MTFNSRMMEFDGSICSVSRRLGVELGTCWMIIRIKKGEWSTLPWIYWK